MIIKITSDLYVNSDAIISLNIFYTLDNAHALLELRNGSSYHISNSAAHGLLALLDANESLILDDSAPLQSSLKSQIARLLRDGTGGVTSKQLDYVFPNAKLEDIIETLALLSDEHTLICIDGKWYHASSNKAQMFLIEQRRIMSSLDPSAEGAMLPDDSLNPAEYNAPTADPKTES